LSSEEAFQQEADELGSSLADADEIQRETKVVSVAVDADSAKVMVNPGGAASPQTYELEKVAGRWMISREAD
jgi:hypothetical protein